jgi:DNA-binding GntR family transcriptional regulator
MSIRCEGTAGLKYQLCGKSLTGGQGSVILKDVPIAPRPKRSSERVSLAEHAYYVIRERILRGEIPLGADLSRRRLAIELEMSLLPVSEALQTLENDGLVESRPRVGTRVCLPTPEQIRERYEIREALESQSARLYAAHADARDKRETENRAEHMDAMFNKCFNGAQPDREFLYAVQSYHLDFHLQIAECAGCHALRAMIEKNNVLIFNWLFDVAASRPPLPPRFHRDLIQALNRGDVKTADEAMREHIRHGRETIVDRLSSPAPKRDFKRVK